jgi:PhoPQ-activated pathogenicity-related protein
LPEFTRLKGERWGWDVKPKQTGPAGKTAADVMESLGTGRGKAYFRLFDPHEWHDLLAGKFVMPAVGTNDPLFHLLSDQFYYEDLACKRAFLRIPNYPHGRTSAQHATGWRFAVAAALLGRPVPVVKLEARPQGDGFEVFASVSNTGPVKRLVIHSTSDPAGDYRRAKWRTNKIAIPENLSRPFRIARVSTPKTGTRAAFLELIDRHELCDSIVHSNVIEIGQAVKHVPDE